MLKRRSKTIAILTAFIFCLTFLGAAFIAPPVAEAACTASVAQSNYCSALGAQNLGYFKVDVNVADWSTASDSQLLVTIPTRLALIPPAVSLSNTFGTGTGDIRVVIPNDADNPLSTLGNTVGNGLNITTPATAGSFFVTINANVATATKANGWFYVYLNNINCSNFAGDVQVNLVPKSGTAFGSSPIPLVVGKVEATGTTTTTCKSIEKITSGGGGINPLGTTPGQIDTITIFENMPNTLNASGTISLELLTKGYSWNIAGAGARGLFAYSAFGPIPAGSSGAEIATVALPAGLAPTPANTNGAFSVGGLRIVVDEKVAKVGQDIEVKVSGAGATEQVIVVAQYVDYVATVIEDTTTELTAGLAEQKLGTFFIEEVAPGTLVQGRTVLFELPAGVEWNTQAIGNGNYELVNNSSITFNGAGAPLDDRTLKVTIGNTSTNSQNGAKVKFKGLKVDVSPSFTGDVVLTVKGKAGVEGTAKVAAVSPMITMTASTPEVNLGIKEQKVSDVEIVETKADTIVARATVGIATADTDMAFYLDQGFRFAKVPKVEVIEGDMVLEVADVKIQSPAVGQNRLIIPIRAASYKTPAKIKISDIYITADRNAPTGDVVMYAADTAVYANIGLCNAFNNTNSANFQFDNAASVAIAKNVTVPPVETKGTTGGGSGTFVIGSNIYTVNGLTRIMDVAPYINNGRTFVPYRYLALALGVAEDDIVWDDSTKKVTVTKGENVVEATIGSTTLTVNGESVTMDVAPEIKNGRTMLPARYLAEALGGSVGWDQASKTVVFEM